MTQSQRALTVFAPGKLVLAGEYAVLAPGGEGLVLAVSAGISARWEASARFEVVVQDSAGPVPFEWQAGTVQFPETLSEATRHYLRFVVAGLEEGLRWVAQRKALDLSQAVRRLAPFRLSVRARGVEIEGPAGPLKLGMGSSAATVVATLTGFWVWTEGVGDLTGQGGRGPERWEAGLPALELTELCVRAVRAHRLAQGGTGSGIDVAASVYGGLVHFLQGSAGPSATRVAGGEALHWRAVWTGQSVATGPRVTSVSQWASKNPEVFQQFVTSCRSLVAALVQALQQSQPGDVVQTLKALRAALRTLGQDAGVEMETPALQRLAEVAEGLGVGKQSGAGGGDCGIVVAASSEALVLLERLLEEAGLPVLPLAISPQGVGWEWLASGA